MLNSDTLFVPTYLLGGLEGAKQRLLNGDDNYRILALSQLINYGH